MHIHFKELSFKNVLSYGASVTTIKFQEGLNLIAGKNGSGKCLRGNTPIEVSVDDKQILNTLINFIPYWRSCCVKDIVDFYSEHPEYIGKINVSTRSGWKTIQYADKTLDDAQILSVELENKKIEGSLHHQVVCNGEWIYLSKLNISDKILTKDGYEDIKSIKLLPFREDLYDLQVEDVHEFYADGIVSHNSTFLDSLSFCLYGKPYRKIKIQELVNRKNKRNLWTRVTFEIDGNNYELTRGRQPNILTVKKNDQELEELSTSALNQEEIDKIIGVDYNMFKQIISLAVNYNKPFLTLNSIEKRSIIESIFNIKIFSDMMKLAKIKSTMLKTQCDIDTKSLKVMEQNIIHLRKQIRELQTAIKDFEKNLQKDLLHNESQINQYEQEINELNENKNKVEERINENIIEDVTLYRKELEQINNNIGVIIYKLEQLKKQYEFLKDKTSCPYCSNEITSEHREAEQTRIIQEKKNEETTLDKLNKQKHTIDKHIEKVEDKKASVQKQHQNISLINQKIIWLTENIEQLKVQKTSIENRKIDFNIQKAQEDLEEKAENYSSLYDQHKHSKHQLHNYECINVILSDNGIKAFFFQKFLPLLNKKINEYLHRFELPIHMEFDNVMDEQIWNRESLQTQVSYYTFSEGEKKRIDMSILLAFIDIAKTICNWNTNLLIFDELLDSAVDDDGLEQIIDCLRNIVKGKRNKSVYVISHRMRDSDQFDNTTILQKIQGFSSLSESS